MNNTPEAKKSPGGLVRVVSLDGHRIAYVELFSRLLELDASIKSRDGLNFLKLISAKRVLFATIDDDLIEYLLVSLVRAAFGRRTVGLYLRPHSCLQAGRRALAKRFTFQALRQCKSVTTLSILPFDLVPALQQVASGSLHDPQLWDLYGVDDPEDASMRSLIREHAAGRQVLAFLGQVSEIKGFPFLAATLHSDRSLLKRFCVVVAGKVSDDCIEIAKDLEQIGVLFISRRLTDPEMTAVYKEAALVWACYDPSYDQASGIFGRATQRGRMVVVREHSLLVQYAEMLGFPALELPFDPVQAALRLASAKIMPTPPIDVRDEWQEFNLNVIKARL